MAWCQALALTADKPLVKLGKGEEGFSDHGEYQCKSIELRHLRSKQDLHPDPVYHKVSYSKHYTFFIQNCFWKSHLSK